MKLLGVAALVLLLQMVRSAPLAQDYDFIERMLSQMKNQNQEARLQQQDYGEEQQNLYDAREMQDYGEEQQNFYNAREMQDYGEEQDFDAQEMQNYGQEQQDYGQQQSYYSAQEMQDYGEEQQNYEAREMQDYGDQVSLQDEFDAEIQGLWDKVKRFGRWAYKKVKAGCRVINRGKRDTEAEAEFVPVGLILETGIGLAKGTAHLVKHACKRIAAKPSSATVEGFLGFSFDNLKNAAQRAYNLARRGCRSYGSTPVLRNGAKALVGSREKYLNAVCSGLNGLGPSRRIAMRMILDRALRTTVRQVEEARLYEERLNAAFAQSFKR